MSAPRPEQTGCLTTIPRRAGDNFNRQESEEAKAVGSSGSAYLDYLIHGQRQLNRIHLELFR